MQLAQGLGRALVAISSFMLKYFDRVITADQSAQWVDDTGIAANDAEKLIKNFRATFKCIQNADFKETKHKFPFGATRIGLFYE